MNQKLKIGLLLEDDYVNKYQKELLELKNLLDVLLISKIQSP